MNDKLRTKILDRFDQLIQTGNELHAQMKADQQRHSVSNPYDFSHPQSHEQHGNYAAWVTSVESLLDTIFPSHPRRIDLRSKVSPLPADFYSVEQITGILRGLKSDFRGGFLTDLARQIEEQVAVDYMRMAEDLLGEGGNQEFAHISAAVIAGIVLERGVRDICQRQVPPIEILKFNGEYEKLDTLITRLKGVVLPAKQDQLRSWAKIRNSAAHGRTEEVKRTDVTEMISGIKTFLAEYL